MENVNEQPLEQKSNNMQFIGNCKVRTNKWNVEEVNLGFNKDHLEMLINNLNDKGWVNIALRVNKTGYKYMYIINPVTPEENINE